MIGLGSSRRQFLAGALAMLALPVGARAEAPLRIVCAGGDVTETVAMLAGVDVIKGVDTTSHVPAGVTSLPSIGYLRQISAEGILSLRPDMLIANRDLGPAPAVEQLRGAGLRIELVDFPPTREGMADKPRHIGRLLGREKQGEELAATIIVTMDDLSRRLEGVGMHPSVGFIRSLDGGAPIAGGRMKLVDATYALAGGSNAFGDFVLFKPVSREVLAASPPDFIVADGQLVSSSGGADRLIDMLGLSAAFAGHPERLVEIDPSVLFSFGPSAANAITQLARRLHADRFAG